MLLFITIIASVRHKCGSSVVEYTIFVIMAHHTTTNSHMAGGITKIVCLVQFVMMMMAGSSSLLNNPLLWRTYCISSSSVLSFLKGPVQPLRTRHRTRRGSRKTRVEEKAALSCWRRRRPHAIAMMIGVRWRGPPATPIIVITVIPPTVLLPAVVGEVEGGGGWRGVPPSLHQAWQLTIWKVHVFPGQVRRQNWMLIIFERLPISLTVIATTSRWFHSAASSGGEMWPVDQIARIFPMKN